MPRIKRRSHSGPQPYDINAIRRAAVAAAFAEADGRRVFILISPFPFMVIGEIAGVEADYVVINIETTHISELEGITARIHLDDVEVFYIEQVDGPRIPVIR